jgi:hypothetical protein
MRALKNKLIPVNWRRVLEPLGCVPPPEFERVFQERQVTPTSWRF